MKNLLTYSFRYYPLEQKTSWDKPLNWSDTKKTQRPGHFSFKYNFIDNVGANLNALYSKGSSQPWKLWQTVKDNSTLYSLSIRTRQISNSEGGMPTIPLNCLWTRTNKDTKALLLSLTSSMEKTIPKENFFHLLLLFLKRLKLECLKRGVGKDSVGFLTTRHLNMETSLIEVK